MGKIFGTDGIRGVPGAPPLDPRTLRRLGMLLADRAGGGRHLLGRDTRESGPGIEESLAEGIAAGGGVAVLGGVLPTPAVSRLLREDGFAGGVVVSASHNPYRDNGIKVLSPAGTKLADAEEEALESLLESGPEPARRPGGAVSREEETWRQRYVEGMVRSGPSLAGLRAVLDCAHGATAGLAPAVWQGLGGEVAAVTGDRPDGRNINDGCGSLHPQPVAEAVRALGADLGLAFDGDGDRAILADAGAVVRDGDDVLFVCASHRHSRADLPGPGVVGTLMTNAGLEAALGGRGIALHRAPVGDRYVLEAMRERGFVLGGEPSGHVIFLESEVAGDGILTGLEVGRVMIEEGRDLSALCAGWARFPQTLVNVEVSGRRPLEAVPALGEAVRGAEEALGGEGRVLLRYSGTEPLLRVMVEGPGEEAVRTLAEGIAEVARRVL